MNFLFTPVSKPVTQSKSGNSKATLPRLPILRKLVVTLLGLVVGLIILDIITGFIVKQFLSEPASLLNDYPNSIGLDTFWSMADQGLKPIVFTGSSTTFYGVNPPKFDSAIQALTGQTVHSVNTGATGEMSKWARDYVVNVFIPKGASAIIYNTEMRAFAGRGTEPSWLESPLGSTFQLPPSLGKNIALWLYQHSTFFRFRNNFHDLLTAKRPVQEHNGSYESMDDYGHATSESVQDDSPVSVPNDWTPLQVEDSFRDALADIATACQAAPETKCIILHMPVHRQLYNTIPQAEMEQFRQMVKDQLGKGKAVFWDFNNEACIAALGADAWKDHDHLNNKGSAKFTYMLAATYASQFLNVPAPADANVDCVKVLM